MRETLYPILNLFITITITVFVCHLSLQIFFWNGTSRRQRLKERAVSNGWVTEGRLTSKNAIHRDSVQARCEGNMSPYHETVSVTYTYYVDGKAYTCSGYIKQNAYGYFETEEMVTVYYNAENPKECVMSEENLDQLQKKDGMLITMALTVLTLALTPHVVNWLFGIKI